MTFDELEALAYEWIAETMQFSPASHLGSSGFSWNLPLIHMSRGIRT